ncbi:conserved hypothetical protein [Culex quinquefasciatus]|uniref:Uncharacterized protein n=1 Tax=Culex quinquefasciatus TaxID=7176 RepID=B0WIG1_CULQU|nr:conserved hypothetical protein [Culex quinquefasciatus]|eukprot:XP_001848495.1 conserved hypothetical protein [Culex quinquefasciatus]
MSVYLLQFLVLGVLENVIFCYNKEIYFNLSTGLRQESAEICVVNTAVPDDECSIIVSPLSEEDSSTVILNLFTNRVLNRFAWIVLVVVDDMVEDAAFMIYIEFVKKFNLLNSLLVGNSAELYSYDLLVDRIRQVFQVDFSQKHLRQVHGWPFKVENPKNGLDPGRAKQILTVVVGFNIRIRSWCQKPLFWQILFGVGSKAYKSLWFERAVLCVLFWLMFILSECYSNKMIAFMFNTRYQPHMQSLEDFYRTNAVAVIPDNEHTRQIPFPNKLVFREKLDELTTDENYLILCDWAQTYINSIYNVDPNTRLNRFYMIPEMVISTMFSNVFLSSSIFAVQFKLSYDKFFEAGIWNHWPLASQSELLMLDFFNRTWENLHGNLNSFKTYSVIALPDNDALGMEFLSLLPPPTRDGAETIFPRKNMYTLSAIIHREIERARDEDSEAAMLLSS